MIADVDLAAARLVSSPVALLERYFRYELRDMQRIPKGATLLVGNHSGGKLPVDIFLLARRWYEHFVWRRPFRFLAHDVLFARPFARSMHRLGAVRANHLNAAEIFSRQEALAVFPGGDYETYRPYRDRFKVDFHGRTGFVRLALQAKVPITPIVTVGSHELFFVLWRGEKLARWLGVKKFFRFDAFPVTVGLPFGLYVGPLPSPWPLPAKITAQALPPVHLWKKEHDHPAYKKSALSDRGALSEMGQLVQQRMQTAMDVLAKERRFPIIG